MNVLREKKISWKKEHAIIKRALVFSRRHEKMTNLTNQVKRLKTVLTRKDSHSCS